MKEQVAILAKELGAIKYYCEPRTLFKPLFLIRLEWPDGTVIQQKHTKLITAITLVKKEHKIKFPPPPKPRKPRSSKSII